MSSPKPRPRKSQPATTGENRDFKQTALGALGLVALSLAVYLPVMRGGFIWDDDLLITANRWIKATGGLAGIWAGRATPDFLPVTSSFFWAEWRIWGMNSTGYHVTNILIHAAAAVLLWRLLVRMKVPGAWLSAALFTVHPVAVGTVAWIAEGKNTLALVFALLSFHFHLRSEEKGHERFHLLSILAFAAGLLSKSAIVMLPCVMLLYDWWKGIRITRREILRLIPFFALSLADAAVTIWFQAERAITGAEIAMGGPLDRLASAAVATTFYLFKALLPLRLSIIYAPPSGIARLLAACFGAGLWLALFAIAWKARPGWSKGAVFGLGSFVLLLLPILGFFKMYFFVFSPVSDHLEYIALPACLATVVAGAARLSRAPRWRFARVASSALLLAGLGSMACLQSALYADGRTLWSFASRSSPQCFAVHFAYGAELSASGDLPGAVREYELAVKLNPRFLKARMNYANLLDQLGRADESIRQYRLAIEMLPEFADPHLGLAIVLARSGAVDRALPEFREALRLDPGNAIAHCDYGFALQNGGRVSDAIGEYERAIALDPTYADARLDLGAAYFNAGDYKDAVMQFRELTRLRPGSPDAHTNLGSALSMAGRGDEAVSEYQAALQIDPGNAKARQNLESALANMRR